MKLGYKYKVKPNLKFFLLDHKKENNKEIDNKAQTDFGFNKKTLLMADKKNQGNSWNKNNKNFKKKKTGRDQGIQVDSEEIFDFKKALKPIVKNITTKVLE